MFGSFRSIPSLILFLLLFISAVRSTSIFQTTLVFATNAGDAEQAISVLQGYGAPYELYLVPETGFKLPILEAKTLCKEPVGLYGLIVVLSRVMYDDGDQGWTSAFTRQQWRKLYAYQHKYAVRMVQLNIPPALVEGVEGVEPGGCCESEEQFVKLVDTSFIPTAGLRRRPLSTRNLWHYPARILDSDPENTQPFLTFSRNSQFPEKTVAGVIKHYHGYRDEMNFFISGGSWSETTMYLGHVWFTWGFRGLYGGFRRVYFSTQVDNLFLSTDTYSSSHARSVDNFRVDTEDLDNHLLWQYKINRAMNDGSKYRIEFGFSGNGNEMIAAPKSHWECPGAIVRSDPPSPDPSAEWKKPLGTGVDTWPQDQKYVWSEHCTLQDPLASWVQKQHHRDSFAFVSHTFTSEDLENATYSDTFNEIKFNRRHAFELGLTRAEGWSPDGVITPAISGLHNGDALKAMYDNGITHVVGDNSRPALRNPSNYYWPLMTTYTDNGFDGVQITPRWQTRIYSDCSTIPENVHEWRDVTNQQGDIHDLMELEQVDNTRNLLSLFQDPYTFQQANLRVHDVAPSTINGIKRRRSLLQMWVESVVAEFNSLVNWPMISKTHDEIAKAFQHRMIRDQCNPTTRLIYREDDHGNKQIAGIQVGAKGYSCPVPIPITIPCGSVTDLLGSRTEKIGHDPLTIWVHLEGEEKTFTLTEPITI